MRLHHLTATAFGPFPGTVEVDLDRLSEAGLFLLTGPTGAGKTSVLDAVCFALYGNVPGDRGAARRLRSDQAAPGVRPEVTLELTVGTRRLRLVRSPQWNRPKRRGEGWTTEQASVVCSELVDGTWTTLSTRLDETGHLVSGVLGMNLTQFTQVAMLPQGRFQAFLRATSDERHQLLQKLFRTDRFERVERWLREERTGLRRRAEAAHDEVADVISRVSEAADESLPETWDLHDLGPVSADLLPWAVGLRTRAAEALSQATADVARAASQEAAAAERLDAARARDGRAARRSAALAEEARLASLADERHRDEAVVAAARRALPVLPVARVAQDAERSLRRTAAAAARALATARGCEDEVGGADLDADLAAELDSPAVDAELDAASASVTHALTVLAGLAGSADRLATASTRLAQTGRARRELAVALEDLAAELEVLPARRDAAREDLAVAERAAAGLRAAEQAVEELAARRRHLADVEALAARHVDAHARWQSAREAVVAARERLLEVREERIASMAAELAGGLAVGGACPVCGSCDHPHRAVRAHGAADAAAERDAQRALDEANSSENVLGQHVRDLATQRDLAQARAGDADHATLARLHTEAEAALATARQAGDRVPAATRRCEDLGRRVEQALSEQAAARARLASCETERRDLVREVADLEGRLAVGLATAERVLDGHAPEPEDGVLDLALPFDEPDAGDGPHEAARLRRLTAELTERQRVLRTAHETRQAALAARRSAEAAATALNEALTEAGFAEVDEAAEAAVPPAEVDRLERALAEHRRRLDAVAVVLAEVGREEALPSADDGDLGACAAAHEAARTALSTSRAAALRSTAATGRLTELTAALEERLTAWGPLLDQHALLARVSAFAEGKSADNALRMRLSAFVLAYRLSQVVAAANTRLGSMSDGRYALEHTGERGTGETRGGLSLLVRDDWSGEARDPATLSGGETFVVSLALALGLADVISAEAGGTVLDTLFVDEGFGSLDADTLDDVLGILDGLREGGRVIGVVSHVAEMRDRIPARLVVTKTRTGSAVALQGV
ncbi:AAA family ATPase [Nocardioides sp. GY 10127]|uniref:AAA family ATPase n=1 Tax=Nocardioides sp. GY 10127 TaxID=2569762 RepID=UPI0010A817F7|nr:AAA family ATPase [Nocardioides sp. GY 10127]TIC86438.1 SMC family ATPase [Nocardioides sp. GY 10127]